MGPHPSKAKPETIRDKTPIALKSCHAGDMKKLTEMFKVGMPIDHPLNAIGQTALMIFCH